MTLLHAKNKVAQKYGYDSWSGKVNGMLTHISNARTIEQRMDEVAILYAQMQVKNLTMHDVTARFFFAFLFRIEINNNKCCK